MKSLINGQQQKLCQFIESHLHNKINTRYFSVFGRQKIKEVIRSKCNKAQWCVHACKTSQVMKKKQKTMLCSFFYLDNKQQNEQWSNS